MICFAHGVQGRIVSQVRHKEKKREIHAETKNYYFGDWRV